MDDRRRELIEQNTHLVDRVVHQLAPRLPRHLDRSELNANGLLGLTEAAERFDFDAGVPFFAFALHRIRGAVMDAARATDYLPSRVRALHRRRCLRYRQRLWQASSPLDAVACALQREALI
jgi:RNA polymerase sigma factor for flagellar operon FliA